MWKAIKEFFGLFEHKHDAVNNQITDTSTKAAPKSTPCGCGRSPTGSCVGLHKLTDEAWALDSRNPNKIVSTILDEVKPQAKKVAPAKKSSATPKKKNAK